MAADIFIPAHRGSHDDDRLASRLPDRGDDIVEGPLHGGANGRLRQIPPPRCYVLEEIVPLRAGELFVVLRLIAGLVAPLFRRIPAGISLSLLHPETHP